MADKCPALNTLIGQNVVTSVDTRVSKEKNTPWGGEGARINAGINAFVFLEISFVAGAS
jgi:hypothetical protein